MGSNNIKENDQAQIHIRVDSSIIQMIDKIRDEKWYGARNNVVNDIFETYFNEDSLAIHVARIEQKQAELAKAILRNQQKTDYMLSVLAGIISTQFSPSSELYENLDKVVASYLNNDNEISESNFKRIGKDCAASSGTNISMPNRATQIKSVRNDEPVNDDALYNSTQHVPQKKPTGISVVRENMSTIEICEVLNDKIERGEELLPTELNLFEHFCKHYPEAFGDKATDYYDEKFS